MTKEQLKQARSNLIADIRKESKKHELTVYSYSEKAVRTNKKEDRDLAMTKIAIHDDRKDFSDTIVNLTWLHFPNSLINE